MKKIRNFGSVVFNTKKSQVNYTHFEKDESGKWKKHHSQQMIKNDVYIPNSEAVAGLRNQKQQSLHKDLFGNNILAMMSCDFFDKNPPDAIRQSPVKFGYDIHPTIKFLAENFEFDEDKDEIPPLRIHYMDIETLVDDKGFLLGWHVGPDKQPERGGVTLISSYDNISDKTTLFGVHPYNDTQNPLKQNVEYIWCKDECGVLREYMKYLKKTDPDIITGWNVADYDIPYIANRLKYCFGENSLWHFGNGNIWIDNNKRRFTSNGINIIDYMVIYKKFELKPRRSYSLANICDVEEIKIDGQGKITYDCSFKDFYEKDWNRFVRYCIQDSRLVEQLDNKKKLMETFIMCCYMAGISFSQAIAQDVSWLRIHDASIYRFCKDRSMELPEKKEAPEETAKFLGAYVMAPKPGVYDYVTVFDVASLYPSCIRALNISIDAYRGQLKSGNVVTQKGPFTVEFYDSLYLSLEDYEIKLLEIHNKNNQNQIDTKIGQPKLFTFKTFEEMRSCFVKNDYCIAANGAIFTKSFRGVISSLLDSWIEIRTKNKKLYFENKQQYQATGDLKYKALAERYNTIQMVYKIRLNSLYGFVGTKWSRFYHTDLAEAVTATGQYVIKSTMEALKRKNPFYDAIYCDTDSIFLHYGKILDYYGISKAHENKEECVQKCIEIDKEVTETIEECMNHICGDIMNTPNMYSFESEEVISRLLITSKKKYIARIVYDKTTGQYPENELTIKGMEFKKSNLSAPIKEFLQDVTLKIMDGATESDIVKILKDKFYKIPNMPIDDIAYAQGVRNIEQYGSLSNLVINSPTDALAYFPPKTPYHVAGAIALNALIDYDPELRDMDKVSEGDKAKIVFVCPTNLFKVKAISLSGSAEWNPKLYEYFKLDEEYMFNRLVLGPLGPAFDAVNFKITMDGILGYKFLDGDNNYIQKCLF